MTKSITESQGGWSDIILTALAPISWGTTYAVATEFLRKHLPPFNFLALPLFSSLS